MNDATGTIKTVLIGALDESGNLVPLQKSEFGGASGGGSGGGDATANNQQLEITKLTEIKEALGNSSDAVEDDYSQHSKIIPLLKGILKNTRDDTFSNSFQLNINIREALLQFGFGSLIKSFTIFYHVLSTDSQARIFIEGSVGDIWNTLIEGSSNILVENTGINSFVSFEIPIKQIRIRLEGTATINFEVFLVGYLTPGNEIL
ncbi:MAG: hypothetical protein HC815_19445 [Richelia sp. RM1_1_1]|nr:hypothetical protein [Richelia sp. RM1_1_1]